MRTSATMSAASSATLVSRAGACPARDRKTSEATATPHMTRGIAMAPSHET